MPFDRVFIKRKHCRNFPDLFVMKIMLNDYLTLNFGKIGYLTSENAIAFAV